MNNYEPIPLFGCEHQWQKIGGVVAYWTSGSAGSEKPKDCPVMQKQKCLLCGGIEYAWGGSQDA